MNALDSQVPANPRDTHITKRFRGFFHSLLTSLHDWEPERWLRWAITHPIPAVAVLSAITAFAVLAEPSLQNLDTPRFRELTGVNPREVNLDLRLNNSIWVRVDWMFISGCVTFVIAWLLSLPLSARFARAIEEIHNIGAVQRRRTGSGGEERGVGEYRNGETPTIDEVRLKLVYEPGKESNWPLRIGVIVVGLLFLAYFAAWAFSGEFLHFAVIGFMFAAVPGYIAGRIIGRMVTFASLDVYLRKQGWKLALRKEHPDTAGGLRPLGSFYLVQLWLLLVPGAFLGTWMVVIRLTGRYEPWFYPYAGLLATVIVFIWLAFLGPTTRIHQQMQNEKDGLLRDVQDRIRDSGREEEMKSLGDEFRSMEALPTWPFDYKIRKNFVLKNLTLLTPYLSLSGQFEPTLKKLLDTLSKL